MKAKELENLLADLNACDDARAWAKGKSLAVAWRTSKRADWMLWLCGRMADKPGWPSRQQVVLAACACARTALRHVPKGELRPLVCIETTERWARGKATIEEVRSAYAAAPAATALWAAYAPAFAASAYTRAAYAAFAPAYAAAYAADAAAYAAGSGSLAKLATLVRKQLRVPGGAV